MDVRFVNPVLESMVQTLSKMAELKPQIDKPIIKKTSVSQGCVTGMMYMNGGNIQGSIALSFSFPVIRALVKKMLRMDIDAVDETASDLAGELSNIVAGQSKIKIADFGFDIEMSLPVILSGKDHTIDHKIDAPVVLLPFKTECGNFFVEVCFKV